MPTDKRVVYLDCNASTPIDPRVLALVRRVMIDEVGNAGSRTHEYGQRAKRAVEHARYQVGNVVDASRDEVTFTSGATESNNLGLLGLAEFGLRTGRQHIVSTAIEHRAVSEPLDELQKRGFSVTWVKPTIGGRVEAQAVREALRADTLAVSVMHVNNETGVVQPLEQIAQLLADHPAYFHVDAAQGFGKELVALKNKRIDLISASGHKICGPMGVGAIIGRRRGLERPPLAPLMFGGGQEKKLRPGTLPVPLIAGFGLAAELAVAEYNLRVQYNEHFKAALVASLKPLAPAINGDPAHTLSSTLNVSFPGFDSEAVILALKDHVAVSNGSACTSASYTPSHVLVAMGLPESRIMGAVRMSWSHLTEHPDFDAIVAAIRNLG